MDEPLQIAERLYLVNSPSNGRFPMAFSFLVMGTDTHALIDTGCGEQACRSVMKRYGVDMVINSHCHPDHAESYRADARRPTGNRYRGNSAAPIFRTRPTA